MESSIIVTVNLAGAVGGCIASTDTQKCVVALDSGKLLTKNIVHTDRSPVACNRTFTISGDIVSSWLTGPAPNWINSGKWRTMSKNQRIAAQVVGYDEGYGTSFEFIHDGGT